MPVRTWLFVPGNRPDRFDKAGASSADEVICDLEDAVAPTEKDTARNDVAWWLSHGATAWIRINGIGTPWYERDVSTLVDLPGLRGLIVPKAEMPTALQSLGRHIDGEESDRSLLLARTTLVLASRVAQKPAPIDGVTTVLNDSEALMAAATRAKQLGFGGKLCVHPAQLAPVAAAFRPSPEAIRWADEIIRDVDPRLAMGQVPESDT